VLIVFLTGYNGRLTGTGLYFILQPPSWVTATVFSGNWEDCGSTGVGPLEEIGLEVMRNDMKFLFHSLAGCVVSLPTIFGETCRTIVRWEQHG
jgi:hypothetical protein